MRVNMKDKDLMKCLIPHWKGERLFLFFLIVVINGLIFINLDIGLDTFKNNLYIHWWVNDLFLMGNKESFTHLMD